MGITVTCLVGLDWFRYTLEVAPEVMGAELMATSSLSSTARLRSAWDWDTEDLDGLNFVFDWNIVTGRDVFLLTIRLDLVGEGGAGVWFR